MTDTSLVSKKNLEIIANCALLYIRKTAQKDFLFKTFPTVLLHLALKVSTLSVL